MRMQEYVEKYDHLSLEGDLLRIPARKEFVLSRIGRGQRVLDVGCLGGQLSRLIMRQGNEVVAVEANPRAAEAARRRGVPVKIADVDSGLPFEAASFDFVHAGEVLEYLFDTRFFFAEAARVLRPGGALLLTTPNLNSWENRLRVVAGAYLDGAGAYPEDRFGDRVRVFNVGKVRELCAQSGFSIAELRGVTALESRGRLLDLPLTAFGRYFPGLSKMLMIRAVKDEDRG